MRKKRNTKSKTARNSLSVLITILFLLGCGYGAFWSIKKFYESINASLTKMNEAPVATITFKHKTAQRKFEERMIWDRLKQHSPVYDGDTIRTADESEATIYFKDGNIMDLGANTMAQIFFHDGQAEMSVSGGSVVVNSENASGGAVLRTGNSQVVVNAGSSIRTDVSQENGLRLNVLQGDVIFSDESGLTRALDKGNSIALNSNSEEQIIPMIAVTAPTPNKKILNFDYEKYPVTFKWSTQNLSDDDYLVLEIAQDKKFKKVIFSQDIKGAEDFTKELENGIYYWRFYPAKSGSDYSAASKLSILHAPSPSLVVPESRAAFSYKNKFPDVRFTWTQNDWTTAFDFEIADNPKMENPVIKQRTTTPSSIVSSLGTGTWYWRVTPFYTINNIGLSAPSEVRAFSISQNNKFQAAELILPAAGEQINTALKNQIAFSWKNNPEAAAYEIKIGQDPQCYDVKIIQKTSSNFWTMKPSEYQMQKGTFYWCVTQIASNGDISEQSEVRKFVTDQIQFEQKALYPPENFATTDINVPELRFTWKSNIPGDNKFQIARDPGFENLVVDQVNNEKSFQGADLGSGEYYWRISSATSPEQYSTKPRAFKVLAPLSAPTLVLPQNNETLTILADTMTNFAWKKVEGADFYQFRFFGAGKLDEPLFAQTVRAESVSLDLTKIPDGDYGWSVQAATDQPDFSARQRSGASGRDLRLLQKRNVALVFPFDGAVLDGVAAITSPGVIRWESEQEVESATFTLSKNRDGISSALVSLESPEREIKLPRLEPGIYYWTVRATNSHGVNISATRPHSFTVDQIKNLDSPRLSLPQNNTVYGVSQIRASRKINFVWRPVLNATSYSFVLRNERGQTILNRRLTQPHFEIADMADLQNGRFTWTVQPSQSLPDGTFLRRGEASSWTFTINLPEAGDIILDDTGVLYGM